MLAAYGVDVLDPRTTARRLAVLLERLPPSARTGGEVWSTEAELLAAVIDYLAYLTWVTLRANGAHSAPKPRPVPRPGRRPPHRSGRRAGPGIPARHKAGSWGEAARHLAKVEGMVVEGG